ncbi:MAG: ferritin-like domain-containing protein [Verrucomicrobiota bacterium JB022]|nr:ferritin-like domain-containing protein [Verrucomicrobiota bacterium JB022]
MQSPILLNAPDKVEENPIALPKKAAGALAARLDVLVSSLFVQFHVAQKHHWLVEGPQWHDLHLYLEEAYKQMHKDLDAVAERMTVLGGIPTSSPAGQQEKAVTQVEAEGYFRIRDGLELELSNEQALIRYTRETIEEALKLSDYGTEHLLKSVLFNMEDRAHHLDHYISSDSLEDGRKES